MPKEKKPGWVYMLSDVVKKEYALHIETGWVYFEDGVRYSPEEIKIMSKDGGTLSAAIHNVKLHFGGEVVRNERGTNTDYQRKSVESSGAKNTVDDSNTGGKIPETTRTSEIEQDGDFDIY